MNIFKKIPPYIANAYLCLITFLLPLVFNNGYLNISQAKSSCFLVLSITMISLSLIHFALNTAINKKINYKPILLDLSVVLFAIANLISATFAKYDADVWLGKDSRMQGAIIIVIYAVVYFIISGNYGSKDSFISWMLLCFSIVSIIAILNAANIDVLGMQPALLSNQTDDFITTIGNINFFGAYVSLMFPVVIVLYCNSTEKIAKWHYTAALILGTFAAVLTSSESFVIGFVVFVAVYLMFCLKKPDTLKRFLISLAIIIPVASVFSNVIKPAINSVYITADLMKIMLHPILSVALTVVCIGLAVCVNKKRFNLTAFKWVYVGLLIIGISTLIFLITYANISSLGTLDKYFKITDQWGTGRGMVYRKCFEVLKGFSAKEWIVGIGPESLQNALNDVGTAYVDQAHNEYLQFLITTGIFGAASYLFMMGATVTVVVKEMKDDTLSLALLMGLVAYFAQAMFNIAQTFTTPLVYIFIAVIASKYKNRIKERSK